MVTQPPLSLVRTSRRHADYQFTEAGLLSVGTSVPVQLAGQRKVRSSELRLGIVDFGTVTQPVGKDVINTAHEIVVAYKKAQQRSGRLVAGREGVNRLKNKEKFDSLRGLKFRTYPAWAAETCRISGFPQKTFPAAPFLLQL
jgi:hypothetical protein